jgi:hypothetical protein
VEVMPNFSVVYFLQMAGFLRNLANFSFQASGMRVTELLVNSAQLSVNSAELSVNMAEFWFFKKSLFLSLTQWILAEF